MSMPENDEFWDFYWETRLQAMENLGKRASILAASRLIRQLAAQASQPLRLLELGSGEGQVIGALADAHAQLCSTRTSVGVDYNSKSVARARHDYPGLRWIEGDFTDAGLLASLGKFEIVLLVNALHEVFSDQYSQSLGQVDVPLAKQRVEQALGGAASCLAPNGWMVLFDGLEPPENPDQTLRVRFLDREAREEFETFALQYRPFHILYQEVDGPLCVELSRHDFTRYLTKSIFLSKRLWQTERLESYQYFNEAEFRAAFAAQGLEIISLSTLTVNDEKWHNKVEILTPDTRFPDEHILILAQPAPKL
jgi:SAM-dependent methyltransferase